MTTVPSTEFGEHIVVRRFVTLGKLIRDRIPKIAEESDGTKLFVRRAVNRNEFQLALADKLVEEAAEAHAEAGRVTGEWSTQKLECEIADLEAVIEVMVAAFGLSRSRINSVRDERAEKRGRFALRLIWEPQEE